MQNNWNYPPTPQNDKKGLRDPIWQFIWGFVSAILAIIGIIVTILALPQAAPIRHGISQTLSQAPAATEPPTATPSPTSTPIPVPTPKVIPENLNIVCLNCNRFFAYSLKLNTIEIDYANQQTITKFTITDIGSDSCTVLFRKLEFQNESGTIFVAQNVGQAIGDIATGNPLIVNSKFDLLPRSNIHYLLSITLDCADHLSYKTQDFVFT